jgi:hypothetical protein
MATAQLEAAGEGGEAVCAAGVGVAVVVGASGGEDVGCGGGGVEGEGAGDGGTPALERSPRSTDTPSSPRPTRAADSKSKSPSRTARWLIPRLGCEVGEGAAGSAELVVEPD